MYTKMIRSSQRRRMMARALRLWLVLLPRGREGLSSEGVGLAVPFGDALQWPQVSHSHQRVWLSWGSLARGKWSKISPEFCTYRIWLGIFKVTVASPTLLMSTVNVWYACSIKRLSTLVFVYTSDLSQNMITLYEPLLQETRCIGHAHISYKDANVLICTKKKKSLLLL